MIPTIVDSWAIIESPWLVSLLFLTFLRYLDLNLAGRVGHQKWIRKLNRMLSFSAGIVWEEWYWRWTLNKYINNMSSQGSSGESADGGPSQQVCFLTFVFQCNGLTSKNHRTPFSMVQSDFIPCCSGWVMHSERWPFDPGWSYFPQISAGWITPHTESFASDRRFCEQPDEPPCSRSQASMWKFSILNY